MIRFLLSPYIRHSRRRQRKNGWRPGTLGYSPSEHFRQQAQDILASFNEAAQRYFDEH